MIYLISLLQLYVHFKWKTHNVKSMAFWSKTARIQMCHFLAVGPSGNDLTSLC